MSKPYVQRATKLTVLPMGDPIFSELATDIEVEDEGGGEFLIISQTSGNVNRRTNSISISPEEWPAIRDAIESMLAGLREESKP